MDAVASHVRINVVQSILSGLWVHCNWKERLETCNKHLAESNNFFAKVWSFAAKWRNFFSSGWWWWWWWSWCREISVPPSFYPPRFSRLWAMSRKRCHSSTRVWQTWNYRWGDFCGSFRMSFWRCKVLSWSNPMNQTFEKFWSQCIDFFFVSPFFWSKFWKVEDWRVELHSVDLIFAGWDLEHGKPQQSPRVETQQKNTCSLWKLRFWKLGKLGEWKFPNPSWLRMFFATFFSCWVGWDGENGDGPCTGCWQLTFLAPSVLTRKKHPAGSDGPHIRGDTCQWAEGNQSGGHQGQVGWWRGSLVLRRFWRDFKQKRGIKVSLSLSNYHGSFHTPGN